MSNKSTSTVLYTIMCASYMGALLNDNEPTLRAFLKVIPILFLLFTTSGRYAYGSRIKFGLLFSSFGDLFLELQELEGFDFFFICGLGSFLIGHIWYIGAYASGEINLRASLLTPPTIFALGMIFVLFPHLDEDLKIPVCVYACVIGMMAGVALCRDSPSDDKSVRLEFNTSYVLGVLGAIVFVISDTTIAVDKFMFTIPNAKIFIMVTYYLAQLGIAMSVHEAVPSSLVDNKKK
jgi:alkenylglycerophosphocholine hydrolase